MPQTINIYLDYLFDERYLGREYESPCIFITNNVQMLWSKKLIAFAYETLLFNVSII